MEMYQAPVDLSQKALIPIDLFLSGKRCTHGGKQMQPMVHCLFCTAGQRVSIPCVGTHSLFFGGGGLLLRLVGAARGERSCFLFVVRDVRRAVFVPTCFCWLFNRKNIR